ncbi:MAG: hypothetical protein ABIR96_10450 [Bdellovibrionota bacterium]
MALLPGLAAAASQGGGGELNAAYSLEFMPFIGKNLPYDLWGANDGLLSVFGLRSSYRLPNPTGSLEVSVFIHHKMPDKAYTAEVAYRHEVYSSFLNGYFDIGVHFSYFDLKPDYKADGSTCVLPGCVTDSGSHSGLSYGGGVMLPVGVYPIKLGVRFYQNPQSWLLLEAGYGLRF